MERGSYPIFLDSFFIFIFGFFCASGAMCVVSTGMEHAYPGVAHTPDRKRGFCLVVDTVFEGIEELKGEFGQPSN